MGSIVSTFHKCKNNVVYENAKAGPKSVINYSLYEFTMICERIFKNNYFITDLWY
jgi:hypothetical protein